MNDTNTTTTVNSGLTGYIIAPLALITVTVNVFFFVFGIKTLEKRAHTMLVISMCGGDCVYGISLFLLAFINKVGGAFSGMCMSQITLIFVSINMALTVALMICIERFLTIKLYNYGILSRSDGWKKKMTAILLCLTNGYVIVCIIAVPRRQIGITVCYMRVFYDPYNYQIIAALLSGLFVCLSLSIIVIYSLILLVISNMMKKVNPLSKAPSNINKESSTVEVSSSIGTELCSDQTYDRICHVKSPQDKSNLNSKKMDARIENTTDIELDPRILSATRVNIEIMDCTDGSSKRKETSDIRKFCAEGNENVNDKNVEVGDRKVKKENALKIAWRKWEFRALATSGYVIGSTLLLHGPMIICLLADGIGHSFPFAIGNISALLVALQCIINPFIYVFRFKELRKAMKKLFCCKKDATVNQ